MTHGHAPETGVAVSLAKSGADDNADTSKQGRRGCGQTLSMKSVCHVWLALILLLALVPVVRAAKPLPSVLEGASSRPTLRALIVARRGKVLAEHGDNGGRLDRAANIKFASKTCSPRCSASLSTRACPSASTSQSPALEGRLTGGEERAVDTGTSVVSALSPESGQSSIRSERSCCRPWSPAATD
jgi:hypothetical protein